MDHFTFSYFSDNYYGNGQEKRVSMSLNGEQTMDQLLEEFKNFMQSVGYSFEINDRLDVINDFQEYAPDRDWDRDDQLDELPISNMGTPYDVPAETTVPYSQEEENLDGGTFLKKSIENSIIPFLENLKKDPDKVLMRWPNRAEIVDKKIQEVRNIIGE